jgi:hypothetical protein
MSTVAVTTSVQPIPVIDLTEETEDDSNIAYPSIGELLNELDEVLPVLEVLQYEDRLLTAGFNNVHQIVDTPAVHTVLENLGVPAGAVEEIIDRAARMTRRTAKSKSTAKSEDSAYGGF